MVYHGSAALEGLGKSRAKDGKNDGVIRLIYASNHCLRQMERTDGSDCVDKIKHFDTFDESVHSLLPHP